MAAYVCDVLENGQCLHWVAQSNFLIELSMLSYSDISQLLSMAAANFALAWVFKKLSQFTFQN